ncbi:PfkB family carbohydrate kinase [Actinomycetaceae bacterium MB13-C1-2]|nr:PfkB family carbohydrate kinase [Actinomycetaceae bacterium MB13-C1-2]
MRIVALGDNCLDVYLEQGHLTVGGNALNVVANCLIAGHEAHYVGPVGSDTAAQEIVRSLNANDISTDNVFPMVGPSGVTLIRLVDNDRQFLFEEFGVCGMWTPSMPESLTVDGQFDWIHVGGPRTMDTDFSTIRQYSRWVSADVSTWDVPEDLDLNDVDVVFASSDDRPGEAILPLAQSILNLGASEVVIMSGPHGSTWVDSDGLVPCNSHPAKRVDTCGAGDSYISGFMMARAAGAGPVEATEAGTVSATKTIQHVGGFPQKTHPIPEWVLSDYEQYIV